MTWLLALAGCVWIPRGTHDDNLADIWGVTIPEGQEVPPCGGIVTVASRGELRTGLMVRWVVGDSDGTGPVEAHAVDGGYEASVVVPADALAGACPTGACDVPVAVSFTLYGAEMGAEGVVRVRQPEVPGVALSSGEPLQGAIRYAPGDALILDPTPDRVTASLCPVGGGSCIEQDFVDGVLPASALDVCPDVGDGWSLTLTARHPACDAGVDAEVATVWFLREDCDADGLPFPDDCDDLDGLVQLQTGWPDLDGDGYGDLASVDHPIAGCDGDAGFALEATDCNDADDTIRPGALDLDCDGTDQDCDLLDGDQGVSDWGPDQDGDTYGTNLSAVTVAHCGLRSSARGTDCDDEDAGVNPGAAELYTDTVDQDCDGVQGFLGFSTDPLEPQLLIHGEGPGGDDAIAVGTSVEVPVLTSLGPGVLWDVEIAAFTADGHPDLVHPSASRDQVVLRMGQAPPAAPLAAASFYTPSISGETVVDIDFGDVDDDGDHDLVVLWRDPMSLSHRVRIHAGPYAGFGQWAPTWVHPLAFAADRLLVGDLDGVCGDEILAWGGANPTLIEHPTEVPSTAYPHLSLPELAGATDIARTASAQLVVLFADELQFWQSGLSPASCADPGACYPHGGHRLHLAPSLDLGIATSDGVVALLMDSTNPGNPTWTGVPVPLAADPGRAVRLGDLDGDGTVDALLATDAPQNLFVADVFGAAAAAQPPEPATAAAHVASLVNGSARRAYFVMPRGAPEETVVVDVGSPPLTTTRTVAIRSDAPPIVLDADARTYVPRCQ